VLSQQVLVDTVVLVQEDAKDDARQLGPIARVWHGWIYGQWQHERLKCARHTHTSLLFDSQLSTVDNATSAAVYVHRAFSTPCASAPS